MLEANLSERIRRGKEQSDAAKKALRELYEAHPEWMVTKPDECWPVIGTWLVWAGLVGAVVWLMLGLYGLLCLAHAL